MVEKARGFGGRIEETGPGVFVASFGIEPLEGAAARAAHAALAIQTATRRARLAEADVAVMLALHCDRLTVRRHGAAWQIALDDKHAALAQLEALVESAEPYAIAVSAQAARLLERRFELTPTQRLVGYGAPDFSVGLRATPYVGRRSERDVLAGRLKQVAMGHGQVVAISGEAGIGKSRLIAEFRREIDADACTWLEGRCVPHGTGVAYLPLLDMLRALCRIREEESLSAVATKVRD